MNNLKIVIPAIIVFILSIAGLYYLYQTQTGGKLNLDTTQEASPKNNFPQASSSASPINVKGAQDKNAPPEQPSTGSDNYQKLNTMIAISSPQQSDIISSPLKIQGFANVTSQLVFIHLKDANGKILSTARASACLNLTPCEFSTTIVFDNPLTKTGTLEAYSKSTFDNTISDQTSLSINFK